MPYLLKTEPDVYSFTDLQRDGETVWDGVTSPAGVKHLREMQAGAKLVIYHTGGLRTAVGTARVVGVDPADPKVPVVRIRCGKPIAPRTLDEMKTQKIFENSELLRQGRLSVVPLTDAQYEWLTKT
jgi:predicted RNA-binding protein with PUA-like domain